MTPREEAAAWADFACVPAPREPSLETAILRHLDAVPVPLEKPTPPNPPRMLRVADGEAIDVLEQIEYAVKALAARGIPLDAMNVTFVDGNCWVHG